MKLDELIHKINNSHGIADLFGSGHWKKAYRQAIMQLHPDKTSNPKAIAAIHKLNKMRVAYEKGHYIQDDAGEIISKNHSAIFQGNHLLLRQSLTNYQKLMSLNNRAALHFHNYLPSSIKMKDGLKTCWPNTAFSLSGHQFPQRHVQWILSRLLEFSAWMAQEGFVHAGLHPESIWIVPKTHGIIIGSFYHLKRRGATIETISSKYQNWYPTDVFTHKKAISRIDIEMIKRTAVYLLGDSSGVGIKLKNTITPTLLDFLLAEHQDPFQCFDQYRGLLKRNFKNEFHPMNI